MMKQLAAKADERWKSIPSFLDAPNKQQAIPAIGVTDSQPADPTEATESDGMPSAVEGTGSVQPQSEEKLQDVGKEAKRKRERKENPWQRPPQGAPGEDWQPASWTPGVAQRR